MQRRPIIPSTSLPASSLPSSRFLGGGVGRQGDPSEEPAEKMRRMEEAITRNRILGSLGAGPIGGGGGGGSGNDDLGRKNYSPSTTIELSAEEAIALGMIQGPVDGIVLGGRAGGGGGRASGDAGVISGGMLTGPEQPVDIAVDEDDDVSENIIVQHMDIAEPLTTLRVLLGQRLRINMNHYEFWLQNQQILDPDKNLVEQCVQVWGKVDQ